MSDFDFFSANSEDILDTRDIIARIEALRDERDSYVEEGAGDAEAYGRTDDGAELAACEALMDEMRGNGGDEEWEGNWYPVTLIRYSYFEESMDGLLEDIGAIPKDIPSYLTITVDYDALKMDYTSVEVDGIEYWYR